MAELLRDLDFELARERPDSISYGCSAIPSSRVLYAGGRDAFGVGGPPGLLERGEEKARIGRGRTGRTREVGAREDDEEEMTEAFRLMSASEGLWVGSCGEDAGEPSVIMSR